MHLLTLLLNDYRYFDFLRLLWKYIAREGGSILTCATVEADMLLAFSDVNESIRKAMLEFWGSTIGLEEDCGARLCSIFKRVYSPPLEASFVPTALYLLLDLGSACDREVGFTSLGGDFHE